jgi:hypothetical protein
MSQIPPPATELANDEMLRLLGILNNAMSILSTFDEPKRQSLYDQLQDALQSFRNLQQIAPQLRSSIPTDVLKLIDRGKNPGDFAKDLIQKAHVVAKRVEAKQKWMQYLKDSLDALVDLNFPDCPERLLDEDVAQPNTE